jgi:DNA-directed RNA polymerase specialized sigma24 family protein
VGHDQQARGVTDRTIRAVWRIESARLIAGLARIVRDVGLAEDFVQDALVAALERCGQRSAHFGCGAETTAASFFPRIAPMKGAPAAG